MEELAELKVRGQFCDGIKPWETLLECITDNLELAGHFDAGTMDEAVHLLRLYHKRAKVIGGGVDILRILKRKYTRELPEVLINIKTIPGLSCIKEENGALKIGALTRLSDIEASELIKAKYGVLAEAASVVGSPQVRNMATIAGSICQDVTCWYYRASNDFYHCWRKGGRDCPAVAGDNRWMFSILGTPEGCQCYATCQSDMAIALSALGALIKTTQRAIPIEHFYTSTFPGTVLNPDEIITEIEMPALAPDTRTKYLKFSVRNSLDHPLVSVAGVATDKEGRIVVGGVYLMPYVVDRVAGLLNGKMLTEDLAVKAGDISVESAVPLSMNIWKVQVMRTLVKRTLESCV